MLLDEIDNEGSHRVPTEVQRGTTRVSRGDGRSVHSHSRANKEDDLTELFWWVGGAIVVAGVTAGGYMVVDNINKQRAAQQQQLLMQQKQQAQPNTLQQQREAQMMDTDRDRQQQVQQPHIPMENPQLSQGYYANSMKIDTPEPTGEVPELEHTLAGYGEINTGQTGRETHGQIRNTLPDNPRLNPPEPTEEPPKKRYKDSAVDIYCPSF